MIIDSDETLKQLLFKNTSLDSAEVDIVVDLPDREWASSLSKPSLNLYLCDIRENRELRENDWMIESNPNHTGTKKQRTVLIALS